MQNDTQSRCQSAISSDDTGAQEIREGLCALAQAVCRNLCCTRAVICTRAGEDLLVVGSWALDSSDLRQPLQGQVITRNDLPDLLDSANPLWYDISAEGVEGALILGGDAVPPAGLEELDPYLKIAAATLKSYHLTTSATTAQNIQQRLHVALEASHMGTWDWDLKTNHNSWSEGLEAIHGLEPGTFGGSFQDFLHDIHPEDRERVISAIEQAVEEKRDHQVEYRIICPDGTEKWVEGRGKPITGRSGNVERMVGVCMDITQRKRVEQALRESESRMAGIISSAMDAIISTDEEQRITVFNHAAEIMFGCSASEVLGKPISMLIPERYRNEHADHIRLFGRSGVSNRSMFRPGTLMGRRWNGEEFPVEATISQVEIRARRFYTVIIRDVTERTRTQEALEESRRILEGLMRHSLEPEATLQGIVEAAQALTKADGAAVLWLNKDRETVTIRASKGLDQTYAIGVTKPLRGSLVRDVLKGYIRGFIPQHKVVTYPLAGLEDGTPANCLIAVPIYAGGAAQGVIEVFYRNHHLSPEMHEQMLGWFAGHASVALEHADAYVREQHTVQAFQRSLLVDPSPDIPNYRVSTRYRAAMEEAAMGGDFYDFIPFPGGRLGIVVGDVSGKGLAAAVHTAMVKYMLRAYTAEDPSPASLFCRLNNALCSHLEEATFVTLFYGLLDPYKNEIRFITAGHEPALVLGADQSVTRYRTSAPVLGVVPDATCEEDRILLNQDETLLLYTDGISEAPRGDGELLGVDGLQDILQQSVEKEAPQMVDEIFKKVERFARGRLRDDVVLLALRRER